MRASLRKHWLLVLLLAILCTGWGMVYFVGGVAGVVSWWLLQLFSLAGCLFALATAAVIFRNAIRRRPCRMSLLVLLVLSLIAAWPICWFAGFGQLAYPAQIHTEKPSVSIRLPINQPALVGWGGDSLATNYHTMAPNERWAYDLVVPPSGMNSDRLEDYGIYGLDVVAPASGLVVAAYDEEADQKPGSGDGESMTGNYVYMKLDQTETYLVIAHLMQGSIRVKEGQHIEEGTVIAKAGNSGNSSEPHIHIHHQRQDPSKTSIFLTEGLPLYFRDIDGPAMPAGGMRMDNGREVPAGDIIVPTTSRFEDTK